MREELLEEAKRVVVRNVDGQFEAEGVEKFGEVRVQFKSLIVFHLIINDINDRIRRWAALLPAEKALFLQSTPNQADLTPGALLPLRTS